MPAPAFQSGYPFSFRSYTADGSTDTFAVPFPYLAQGHVKVYVDGTLQLSGYSWVTSASIQFAVDPAADAVVLIRRETPVNPLVTYTNAASLKASNLNTDSKQALYVFQEIADLTIGEVLLGQDLIDARAQAVAAAAAAAVARDDAIDAQELSEAARDAAEGFRDDAQAIADALSTSYDIGNSVPFLPAAGEVCMVHAVARSLTINIDAPGSYVSLPVVGDGDLEVTFYKNGVSFGTCTVTGGTANGSFDVASAVFLTAGDRVSAKVTSANPGAAPEGFGILIKCILEL